MKNKRKNILVTGGSGYLASWIVKELLEEGHRVHTTVRSLQNKEKIEHLLDMKKNSPDRLKLFECDLLKEGSFDEAMQECEIVIHTASPYFLNKPKDIQSELINPALYGTQNVLNSVNKTLSVTRVVLTSSVVALYNDAKELADRREHKVQEKDTNQNQDITYNSYAYSKVKAEALAWKMQQQQDRWDLISIHPGAIFGPSLSKRTDATSIDMMIKFLNGSYRTGVPKLWLGLVDVRDVAQIHILAALNKEAKGKYIAMSKSITLLEIAKLLDISKHGIVDKLPKKELPKILIWLLAPLLGMSRKYISNNVNYPIDFDNTHSISDLQIKYHTPAETLDDHIAQLLQDCIIQYEK